MVSGDLSPWANLSKLARSLLLGQSLIIIALSTWLYQEYQKNQYLQTYLAATFQEQGSILALLGLGGILAIGFVGILLKAGNIMGEIDRLSSRIDRTGNVPIVEAPSPMPILEVVDPRADYVSQIHGSMRRWSEHSKASRK